MNSCPQCGKTFECRARAGQEEPCWCTQLPALPTGTYATDKGRGAANNCFCPDCLLALLVKANVTS